MRIGLAALILLVARPPRRSSAAGARGWRLAIALGVVMAVMNSLFYLAIARIPLGVAVTIEFWGPLMVAVVGSRRARDLVWVVSAAVGIWLLAGGRLTADDAVGIAAAFGAGGCWALFIVVGGRMSRAWPDGRGLTVTMTVAALLVLPVALAGGAVDAIRAEPSVLLGGLVIALLSSTIPYTLEVAAMRRIPSATYGVLMSLEPAVAAIVGFVLLGQLLTSVDVVAIALVGVASAGASVTSRRLEVTPGELEAA
jgi:inner membrane transporter RhtA